MNELTTDYDDFGHMIFMPQEGRRPVDRETGLRRACPHCGRPMRAAGTQDGADRPSGNAATGAPMLWITRTFL